MSTIRRSTIFWWVRLAAAAFVLCAWMTVAATAGVANADDSPPSHDQTKSDTAQAARETSAAGATKSDPPRRPGATLQRLTRHLGSEIRDLITDRVNAGPADPTTRSPRKPKSVRQQPQSETADTARGNPVEATGDAADDAGASADVITLRPSRLGGVRHGERALDGVRAAVQPTNIFSRRATAGTATTPREPNPAPPSANLTPADPPAPISPGIAPPSPQQLGRAATGFFSDAGVVAASAVYTAAQAVATVFGPNDFSGVPYALATALANTAAAAGRSFMGAGFDVPESGRFTVTYGVFNGLALFNPQQPPPGANDDTVVVTHPTPIILLNGTGVTQGVNWSVGAPVLANAGYKVYTFNYGNVTGDPNFPIQATGDIAKSAEELDVEIDRVLQETGAEKVILIGHSQGGGILPAYYINNVEGGADKVSQVIGIAPSNHGTDFNGLVALFQLPVVGPLALSLTGLIGPAATQQLVGSDFQQVVYGKQDSDPNVLYTNIITMNDEIVTPYTQQLLTGPSVTNVILQQRFPGYPAGHAGVVLDPRVWSVVLEALAANPEANPQLHPQDSAEMAA